MNTFRAISSFVALGLVTAGLVGVGPALAADCYGIGQQLAAQNGGQLASVREADRGGQPVCVVVVLVPGKDGGRPRRQEFVVPAN